MRVLIADDDSISRTTLQLVLQKFGYVPVVSCDGDDAWTQLQQPDAPQIAILDWMMPGISGPELCQRLRAQKRDAALYLVLLTAMHDSAHIVAGLKAGADDYITKPFNLAEFQARMDVGRRIVQLQNHQLKNISDLRRLTAEQQLNIDQAKRLLNLASVGMPQWINVDDTRTLHMAALSRSCKRAGGDHYWAHTLPANEARGAVTTINLQDQSGHEVNCILRSIATDLLHREILAKGGPIEEQMAQLNNRLCHSGLFAEDDFLTGMTLELDHANLQLRYVSCGHPPLILIRGTQVITLPENGGIGQNFPLGILEDRTFSAGQIDLREGDRILLYTDGLADLEKNRESQLSVPEYIVQLVQKILKVSPHIPVNKLIRRLFETAANGEAPELVAEVPDDVTLLGLEIETNTQNREIKVHPKNIQDVSVIAKELSPTILMDWQMDESQSLTLRLFLEETLTNAWCHGNRQNPVLPIRVRWGRHNGYALEVMDEGQGFNVDEVKDPRSPEGRLQESGRGLHLIKTVCDWVHWRHGGAHLVARFSGGKPKPH
jgi:DNA-binding response OmpR family regulator/anti-sigma regulatory factor (Ser/Thr protein kinase)